MTPFSMRGADGVRAILPAAVAVVALLGAPPSLAAQGGSVAAPERIWAAQTGPRELTLAWDSVPGAAGFRLYKVGGSGADTARVIGNVVAAVRRWVVVVTPAMISTPQQFAIEALDAAKRPSPRAAFNVVTPITVTPGGGPLPGPAAVTASEGGGGVTVMWDAVPGATAYIIGRAVRPDGFRPLCTLCSTSTTYVDRNTTPGAAHAYSVTAVTPRTTSRTTRSNEVTPTGGGIVAGGGGTTDGSGGTGTGGTGTGGTGGGSTTDSTVGSGGTNTTGGSGGSTTPLTVPPTPVNLYTEKRGSTAIGMRWDGATSTETFRISRSLCGRPPQEAKSLAATTGYSRWWTDTIPMSAINASCPIASPVSVRYTIVAANAAGSSPPGSFPAISLLAPMYLGSGTGGATATAAPLPAPVPVSAVATGARQAALVWKVSSGATSYQLLRSVCTTAAVPVKMVTPTAGSPDVKATDDVPWTTINSTCPIGATTARIVYFVAAKNESGGTSTSVSFAPVMLALGDVVVGTKPPSNVWGATATITPTNAVLLKWSYGLADATSFRIDRMVQGGTYQTLAKLPSSAGSHTDTTPGIVKQNPKYRIVSVNANGTSSGVEVTPTP